MHLKVILVLLFFSMALPAGAQQAKPLRIGIAGLTHAHVNWLLSRAHDSDIQVVGIAEANHEVAERYLKKYDLQENALKEKKPENEVNNRTIKTDSLIEISNQKKQYILKNFFKKELEDVNELFFIKDNFKFQKFLIERAAIALK